MRGSEFAVLAPYLQQAIAAIDQYMPWYEKRLTLFATQRIRFGERYKILEAIPENLPEELGKKLVESVVSSGTQTDDENDTTEPKGLWTDVTRECVRWMRKSQLEVEADAIEEHLGKADSNGNSTDEKACKACREAAEAVRSILVACLYRLPSAGRHGHPPAGEGTDNGNPTMPEAETPEVEGGGNAGQNSSQRGYLASELRAMAGVSQGTLYNYVKKAGIRPPGRGKREHRYSVGNARRILVAIRDNSLDTETIQKCEVSLQGLPVGDSDASPDRNEITS